MKNITIMNQMEMIQKTNSLIKRYGLKNVWIEEQTGIPSRVLSSFLNQRYVLSINQYERLKNFVERYAKHMNGFFAD